MSFLLPATLFEVVQKKNPCSGELSVFKVCNNSNDDKTLVQHIYSGVNFRCICLTTADAFGLPLN